MPYAGIKSRLNGQDIVTIKKEFFELYLEQNLELKIIAKYFKSKGLDASQQQWKTQITIWGIRKHNRESDMLFAIRKAKERKDRFGKDTIFNIRGQPKTLRDIEHYFQRKSDLKDVILNVGPGSTPAAITYFSPPASPTTSESQLDLPAAERKQTVLEDDGQPSGRSSYDNPDSDRDVQRETPPASEHAVDYIRRQLSYVTKRHSSQSIKILPLLRPPEVFHTTEIALSSVSNFYGSMISVGKHALVQEQSTPEAHIERLLGDLDASRYHIEMGNIYSAEVLWHSAVKRLATLMDDLNPIHLSRLMLGVRYFCDPMYEDQRRDAICTAMRLSLRKRKDDNPFSIILRMLASSHDFFSLMEKVLAYGIDYLTKQLPPGDDLWFVVVKDLCGIASMSCNWEVALKCVLNMRQAVESQDDITGRHFQRKIDCLRSCAGVYMQLGRYKEAHETLCEYEALVIKEVGYGFTYYVRYLPSLAEFRRRIANRHGAVLALRTSWDWCHTNLNIEDPEMVQIAKHLQDAEMGGRYWNLI